jgi:ribulose-bisphosphate carboxylase large chain
MTARLNVTYRVRSDAASIAVRAKAIAVEQSVEMPVEAIEDQTVLAGIVGQVESIVPAEDGVFAVSIGLAAETTGFEIGQLMNMLFGNSSIQDDVTLEDVEFPSELTAAFAGPRHGLDGLRWRVGAEGRALTCSALKPQGLPVADLAKLAGRLAEGGLDYIKDDHGLADQRYSPFAERVRACALAVAAAGGRTRYVPSLSGHLDQLRLQAAIALDAGIDTVLVAPMTLGLPGTHALIREFPDLAFMAHPALAGAARIAPPLLLGKIFRLIGIDATVFPNHGGRFGYSPDTCRALAAASRDPWAGYRATLPVPAGGMTRARTAELLDFYGPDSMLLIGGNLLSARANLVAEARAFAAAVQRHPYR